MRGGEARVRGTLPLRAMVQGELLDTAILLFRARALPLLLIAAPLLAIEQVVLWFAGAYWLDGFAEFSDWWRVIAALLGCEAVIGGPLGAYAGAAAVPALLGQKVGHWQLVKRMRPLPVLVTMVIPGAAAFPAAYFGLVGWFVIYGFLGLAGVALVIDRPAWPFGALGRSAALAARLGWRGFWARFRGFLVWFGIRVALAIGPITFLMQFGLVANGYFGDWPVLMMWGLAGTVTGAALACFDAVLLIDTRIRTEGLDIALRRALANGTDLAGVLTHTRPTIVTPPLGVPSLGPSRPAAPEPTVPPGRAS
ncbi:hypothetical protein HH310_27240 [Actinoplanes sp. TBRC 11911]|uniref:hypothetical protein n=1 Tax=Actinoplanes sp. TBRC 11911 TaxID=2729386 RepID=UPI00145E5355|nr:hypothetical protein [Actinoplanes sp. TBRC 11911]NMO54866.1 hypothetical protein [Actinoplanes sp. TBRC 11911]